MDTSTPSTWFITGASSGLGRVLAEQLLLAGHRVAGTARKADSLEGLAASYGEQFLALPMDVTLTESVDAAVGAAWSAFGRVDVVVSNAGYGLIGALEEYTDAQIQANLQTNLVGHWTLFRAVIPRLRAQGGGRLLATSAIASVSNELGFSVYGATKAALDATCESLRGELKAFGIHVSVITPGPFRTEFISRSLDHATPMPEYRASVGQFASFLSKIDGKQAGDPVKAAQAIMQLAAADKPPFRLLLGKYAYLKMQKKLQAETAEMDSWRSVGEPTDF